MKKCFICGKTEAEQGILKGIYSGEIRDVCTGCAEREEIPTIKTPTADQLKESERPYSLNERLERMSGVRREFWKSRRETFIPDVIKIKPRVKHDYSNLNLVENFNWVVMNARRRAKLSHKQIAEAIAESESAIKMVENGELPAEPNKLISKLEQFFRINIVKKEEKEEQPEIEESLIGKQVEFIDELDSETNAEPAEAGLEDRSESDGQVKSEVP